MSYDENDDVGSGFKMGADDDESIEPLDMEEIPDLGLEDDPEDKFH